MDLAERKGFEPLVDSRPSPVFKTGPLNRSGISPDEKPLPLRDNGFFDSFRFLAGINHFSTARTDITIDIFNNYYVILMSVFKVLHRWKHFIATCVTDTVIRHLNHLQVCGKKKNCSCTPDSPSRTSTHEDHSIFVIMGSQDVDMAIFSHMGRSLSYQRARCIVLLPPSSINIIVFCILK